MAEAEDPQNAGMTSILMERRARKLAADDALRLYNRVRQLHKEEHKAQRRIQDTKKKAKDIIRYRERNELARQERDARQKELALLIEKQKEQNLQLKEETLRAKAEQEARIWELKSSSATQTKEERAELERLLEKQKYEQKREALELKESVQRAHEEARRKIEQLKLDKLQMAQDEYERRLKEEMDAKAAKEAEIQRLAEVELQLIQRLKHKQQEQRKAYQQLEAVIMLGASSPPSHYKGSKGKSPGSSSPSPAKTQQPGEPTDEDVARAFSIYDEDAVGEISTAHLDALLRDLGVALQPSQLGQAIAQLDTSEAGKITFGEFLMWWKG